MGGLSISHWVVIGLVVVLLFGAKRLPDAARGLGRSMRILKAETKGLADDDKATNAEAAPPPAASPVAPQSSVAPRDTSI